MSATSFHAHVDDYLRLRRGLGFKLERAGQILPQLVAYLEAAGASTVTRALAISWAQLPASARPQHWASRLAIARGFAAYLQTTDPGPRFRRLACSLSAMSARPRTCGRRPTSASCLSRRGRSRRR